jgi:hypothetical protein
MTRLQRLFAHKAKGFNAKIAAITPTKDIVSYFAAHPVMGDGGRFCISSNPSSHLPGNNLNHYVQQMGLGRLETYEHDEWEKQNITDLYRLNQSAEELI